MILFLLEGSCAIFTLSPYEHTTNAVSLSKKDTQVQS